jgi:ABC-type antimicrobial peptide transport system permease subunit
MIIALIIYLIGVVLAYFLVGYADYKGYKDDKDADSDSYMPAIVTLLSWFAAIACLIVLLIMIKPANFYKKRNK